VRHLSRRECCGPSGSRGPAPPDAAGTPDRAVLRPRGVSRRGRLVATRAASARRLWHHVRVRRPRSEIGTREHPINGGGVGRKVRPASGAVSPDRIQGPLAAMAHVSGAGSRSRGTRRLSALATSIVCAGGDHTLWS
jgi:hypothetical protein